MLEKIKLEKLVYPVKRRAWLHASTGKNFLRGISLNSTESLMNHLIDIIEPVAYFSLAF